MPVSSIYSERISRRRNERENVLDNGLININGDSVQTLDIIILMTVITLIPMMVVMMSSFTRYVISLSFLRNAMGTQQTPPNMVLVGLALFLTLFTMGPVIEEIQTDAYTPYVNEEITQEEFFDRAQTPLKRFMVRNTEPSAIRMYCNMGGFDMPANVEEGTELPFLLIDVVVSTTLMAMGMVMLPPAMISTPFKLLFFISLNGWELVFSNLVRGFN